MEIESSSSMMDPISAGGGGCGGGGAAPAGDGETHIALHPVRYGMSLSLLLLFLLFSVTCWVVWLYFL